MRISQLIAKMMNVIEQFVLKTLDFFVPNNVFALNKAEELNRARTLVLVLLLNILATSAALIIGLLYFPSIIYSLGIKATQVMVIACVGHGMALIIFMMTGRTLISANIFALTFYAGIFVSILAFRKIDLYGSLFYLPILPLIMTFVADFNSGVFWSIAVMATPELLTFFGEQKIGWIFDINWILSCLGIYIINCAVHIYIRRLSARLNNQCNLLKIAATHDGLTGLVNRSSFDLLLDENIQRCKEQNTQAVLVYIDLDKFKPINDTYGHQVGDAVLIVIARRLRQMVREKDVVARLGGDEFALLFCQNSAGEIAAILQRLNIMIEETIVVASVHLNVGCSVGVVMCPEDGTDAIQLSRKADERMYDAKRNVQSSHANQFSGLTH